MKIKKGAKPLATFTMPVVWPSINDWAHNPYTLNRQKKKWQNGIALVVNCWMNKNKIRMFTVPVHAEIDLYFAGQSRGRDEDNYAPKWFHDALKGLLVKDDSKKYLTHTVRLHENADRDETVVRFYERAQTVAPGG